jgi:4-alpha-glucanotransferase
MSFSPLDSLIEIRGIESKFVDAWGKDAQIAPGTKEKMLKAMGYSVDEPEVLAKECEAEITSFWTRPIHAVQVLREHQPAVLTVRLPLECANDEMTLRFTLEDGAILNQSFVPVDHMLVGATEIANGEFHEYAVTVDVPLPLGYHRVALTAISIVDESEECLGEGVVIMAPEACYTPAAIKHGKKVWGLSVQLYCVRSERNWGIGDFTDLSYLIQKSAEQGADFIGLNPIHALYPNNPDACSPYSPSSRKWLNHLYIDPTALPYFDSPAVQSIVTGAEFISKLAAVRALEYIDYEAVSDLKLPVLEAIFKEYQQHANHDDFEAFITAGGDSLQALAIYDAIQAHLKASGKDFWGWPVFPAALQDMSNPAVITFAKEHALSVRFYLFLQYMADQQYQRASAVADERGMTIGLYRDLAVGVSEGSAEVWSAKDLYVTQASVGAPPDILGPLGQNWGLPPMDPKALYEQAYQPIIELFRANMANSGALRIDHAMALLRLWWVYQGDTADKGGYVYYPVDDLLGILALESQRNQTLIIGEDLGTVPEEIRDKLAANGVYSYRVFFFEQAEDGGFYSPSHYPVQSMSTLTIHDFPTLIGYWHCYDLELGSKIGLYPTQEILDPLYESRHENKQQILNTLHGHGAISENVGRDVNYVGMTQELNYGMQVHMATGSSALLSLQLEDWLQMDKPVNIPGTFKEYPNWKRKLTRNLEDIFTDPELINLAQYITSARRKAGA